MCYIPAYMYLVLDLLRGRPVAYVRKTVMDSLAEAERGFSLMAETESLEPLTDVFTGSIKYLGQSA